MSEAGEADTLKHRVAGTGHLRSTLCVTPSWRVTSVAAESDLVCVQT